MLLGHPTYLNAKAAGDNSLSGKPECRAATQRPVRQDPDGKVTAALPEPQCPNCNHSGRKRWLSSGCFLGMA